MHTKRITVLAFLGFALSGCQHDLYDPAKATRAYPELLHTTQTVDMQVFRDGPDLEIVNSTAKSYEDVDIWINQRYVHHVDAIPAGKIVQLSLWDFYDEGGEVINAGGFFRTVEPTPVRLVEVQSGDNTPMFGLVTIRAEEADIRPTPGR